MSITSARNFIEKSGCGWIVGAGLAVVMIAGIFNSGNCRGNANQEAEANKIPPIPVATYGKQTVDLNVLRDLADKNVQSLAGGEGGVDPAMEGRLYGDVGQALVSRALVSEVAREQNISVSDDELRKEFDTQLEGQIFQTKVQLMNQKMLKPEATEADFADAFQKAVGKSLDQVKAEAKDNFTKSIADPAKRDDLAYNLIGKKVTESYKAKITLSDADLKKGFDTYTTKRVIAYSNKGTAKEQRDRIEKARAAVMAGTLSFESAMNTYSDDPLPANMKSKGESTVDLQYSILTYDVSLKPILKLKVGEVSPILQTSSGPAIFKLIKIQNKVPATFEKDKATLRSQRLSELATKAASDDLRNKLADVKYLSPTLKVLVEWRTIAGNPEITSDLPTYKSKLKALYEEIKSANETILEGRMVALGTYALFKEYYDLLTPQEQAPLAAERLEKLSAALENTPNYEGYHDLVKLAMAQKAGPALFAGLKGAIEYNTGSSEQAEARHKSNKVLLSQAQTAGLIKGDEAKTLEASLTTWESQIVDDLKLAAESNGDYTEVGEAEYKGELSRLARYQAAGWAKPDVASEVKKAIEKWKTGVFADLKMQIESNVDYSPTGQETFSNLNARIGKFRDAGYITVDEYKQAMALQEKWRTEKKKADDEAAKAAEKAKASTPPNTGPAKTPTGSSGDLLKGSTTGK